MKQMEDKAADELEDGSLDSSITIKSATIEKLVECIFESATFGILKLLFPQFRFFFFTFLK
jgi:hypothetical protein